MLKTYGTLSFNATRDLWIISDCTPHTRSRLKAIFPRIKKTARPPYTFQNTPQNASDIAWFESRYPLAMTNDDRSKLKKSVKAHAKIKQKLDQIYTQEFNESPTLTLKPGMRGYTHQIQNAAIHAISKGLLVGDDMGLGKTITGILTLGHKDHLPVAIVMKTALQEQWKSVISKFTDFEVFIVNTTTPHKLPKTAAIVLFRYSQLAGWSDFFETGYFKSVIFDEIQELRTGKKSQKGAGAMILADNANARLGLSAHPVMNYGAEIFNIYQFIRPELLGDRSDFYTEWVNDDLKTLREPDALREYLIDNHAFIRKSKNDVGQDGQNVGYQTIFMPYDESEISTDSIQAEQLAIATLKATNMKEMEQIGFKLDVLMRQMTGIAKAKGIAEYVKIIAEQGLKVVLVGYHRRVYEIWQEQFKNIDYVMYTGSESTKEKNEAKDQFIHGNAQVFILSIESAEGIDGLQHVCSTIIIGELPWNKPKIDQSVGRLDRDGQTEQVSCMYMLANGGSDPIIMDIIARKSADAESLIKGSENTDKLSPIQDAPKFQNLAASYLLSIGYHQDEIDKMKS